VRTAPAEPSGTPGRPEWVIPASERRALQKAGWGEDIGTNSAPILD
jgi:hypothetical protein